MMTIMAYLIVSLLLIRLLIVISNWVFGPALRQAHIENGPFVSVLIPARDEEENIVNLLDDLMDQDYMNMEIIVFDDQSSDHTADKVEMYMERHPEIQLIR